MNTVLYDSVNDYVYSGGNNYLNSNAKQNLFLEIRYASFGLVKKTFNNPLPTSLTYMTAQTSYLLGNNYGACLNYYLNSDASYPVTYPTYLGYYAQEVVSPYTSNINYFTSASTILQCLDNILYSNGTDTSMAIVYKATDTSNNIQTYIGYIYDIYSSTTMSIYQIDNYGVNINIT